MDRIKLHAAISIGCAAAIGFLLVYATEIGLALSILMPTVCFVQMRRIYAFLVAFAYYGAASSILIHGISSFFGPGSTLQLAFALWGIACLLLALPFGALWSKNRLAARWRGPLAVAASVPPPLGIIGWANPLTSAGILFPRTAWFGLLAVLGFVALSPMCPRISILVLLIVASIVNAGFPGVPSAASDLDGVDTAFGDVSSRAATILKQYEMAQYIQQRALDSRARIIVFPETVIHRWSEATDLFWEPTFLSLSAEGKTLLLGTTIDIPGTDGYLNVVILRGSRTGMYSQRIPVPVGMWWPFRADSVPLQPLGTPVVRIGDVRAAVLICYEQFLVWPALHSLLYRPTVLVGISNVYWSRETRIPAVQRKLFRVWARLFGVPFVSAMNI